MLDADDDLKAALQDHTEAVYQVASFYGADQTIADVPITSNGSLDFNADQVIQTSGSIYLATDGGQSYVPKSLTDPLAPFGQEVTIQRKVTVGETSWSIPMGRLRISDVPDAQEYFALYPSQAVRVGWSAQLQLVDRFDIIQADDFLATTSPVAGNTTWDEIQRLSPIPIVKTGTDVDLPSGLVYTGRMDAITTLWANLGMVPILTREGSMTGRVKDAWLTATETVFSIKGVISLSGGMSNAIYNSVAVTTSNNDQILGIAEITDESNPLCVTGPLGRRTYTHQDPLLTSQSGADAEAKTILKRVSTRQSHTVTVTCLPNPLIELGDFGVAKDTISGQTVTGEVTAMRFQMDPLASMELDLIVAEIS